MPISSLFISTDLPKDNELVDFCKVNSIDLTAQSLLKFEAVLGNCPDNYPVVFFASVRCYEFYIGSLDNKLIAVYGQATADKIIARTPEIREQIKFIGPETNDPSFIAKSLEKWLDGRKALFPIGSKSLKSISKHLLDKQYTECVVYQTVLDPKPIPQKNVCVFTSPSNAESYFKLNSIDNETVYLAWGKSTFAYLQSHEIPSKVLSESNVESLISFLSKNK